MNYTEILAPCGVWYKIKDLEKNFILDFTKIENNYQVR